MSRRQRVNLLLAVLLSSSATAYLVPPSSPLVRRRPLATTRTILYKSSPSPTADEPSSSEISSASAQLDAALRDNDLSAANRILKQHSQLELSRAQWDAIFGAIEATTSSADQEATTTEAVAAEFPLQSAARQDMTALYQTLSEQGHLQLFGAVAEPLAAGSHSVPPPLLETILDLKLSALTPQPTNTLLLAGVGAAVLEVIVSLATGIPINALFLTTLLIATLDRLFVNGAVLESLLKVLSPGTQAKIVRHEAGHFLTAYLLGCPVEGIVLSAWAALQDRRFGTRQVSAGTSFYDPQLSQQINTSTRVTRSSIDRYSTIVMAGIAAEADAYGRADGGAGDEMALVAFLSQLNAGKTTWNSDSIRNQARWGAMQAVLMLREYQPAYEALVDALERGGRLGDCIHAIEAAARENGLNKAAKPLGWIVEEGSEVKWTTENPVQANEVEAQAVVEPFDEEASLEELTRYRTEVEDRLRDIEERLKEIQD